MRPVPRTPRVAPFRLTALVVAATLVLSVVPSVPAVADPPDVVYSYAFTGDNEAAWGAGWTHLSSDPTEEYPVLEDNVGVLDASGHGVLSLRPETISDAVQQLKGVFYDPDEDGQTWGLAMRSDGSDFWSDSGYHCIFDYYDNDENPELYIARVSNGVRVWLGEPVEIAVSGDFWLKCEAEGSDLRAKVWADGASEPSAWSVAVSDSTYATGRAGVLLDGVGSVDIVVDDYSLEGFSSAPIPPLDPGGGDTFTDPFVGDDADPWGSEWAHLSSSTGVPFLFGGSGGIDPDDVDLAVTSLRPTTYTDSEQLARVIWYPEGNRHWGLVARHDGAGEGSQSGYYCTLTFDEDINDEEPTLAILRYDSGSLTVLDETVVSVATNQWLKCAAEGDQIMRECGTRALRNRWRGISQ